MSQAGSYVASAVYDNGSGGAPELTTSDSLQVVSTDTAVPSVRITHINGTLIGPADCTATECSIPGDPGFARNQRITSTLEASDDTRLAEVRYKIAGSGVSAGDNALVGSGSSCVTGTPPRVGRWRKWVPRILVSQ